MKTQLIFSDEQKRTCAIGAKANLDYKRMLYDKNNSLQNAKVGKNYPEWGGMPAAQARAIYRKDYVIKNTGPIGLGRLQAEQCPYGKDTTTYIGKDVFKNKGPIDLCGLKAEQCPGAHDCMPAGRRSRTEWCNCGKIIE